MTEKRISSNWTKPILIIMVLIWIIFLPIIIFGAGGSFNFEAGQIFAGVLYLLLMGITVYLSLYLSEVKINDKEISFKKIFRAKKTYSFDGIGHTSTFRYKRLKFTSVEMEDKNGIAERFLILNNNALLSGERIDAEAMLDALRKK
jgi:hypothetical protein